MHIDKTQSYVYTNLVVFYICSTSSRIEWLRSTSKMATAIESGTSYFSTTTSLYDYDTLYKTEDLLYQTIGTITLFIGTVGHILSIITVMLTKTMRTQSTSIYIIAMSLAGLATLYTGLLRHVILVFSNWEIDIRSMSQISCKLQTMVTYLSLQYFAWIQATIAVDRFIAVWFPIKYKTACSWKLGLLVVVIELVAAAALNSLVYVGKGITDSGHCGELKEKLITDYFYVDLFSFSLVPATITIICNSLLLYRLSRTTKVSGSKDKRLRALTVMLTVVNAVFVVTTLPVSIYYLVHQNVDSVKNNDRVTIVGVACFHLLQYFGTAVTFFLYCITGTQFRESLKQVFSVCIPSGQLSRSGTESTVI